jgi:hypothetical protein
VIGHLSSSGAAKSGRYLWLIALANGFPLEPQAGAASFAIAVLLWWLTGANIMLRLVSVGFIFRALNFIRSHNFRTDGKVLI